MTVIGTGISWTNSTWNLWIGCDKVSAGCDNCYAESLVNRSRTFGQTFDEVRLRLERLSHVTKFMPLKQDGGDYAPHMVFVNSMSDFWHEKVPDEVLHRVLDLMERHPTVVFQILTKRPIRARKLLTARYGGKGIPSHLWIGVSTEDNRVRKRLDIMRSIKQRAGGGTFFVSVEPIVEATDMLDFTDMDWIITGGESGPGARTMERAWLMPAVENTLKAGIALWHKQSGKTASHPNIDRVPERLAHRPGDQFRWLRENGWETLPQEKGGATIDKRTYRQLPPVYHELRTELSRRLT